MDATALLRRGEWIREGEYEPAMRRCAEDAGREVRRKGGPSVKDLRRNLCEPMPRVKGLGRLRVLSGSKAWQKNKRLDYI